MNQYINFTALADWYNAMVAGWVLLLTTVFGTHWYLFAALLFFNVADWLTGWYKARKNKEESSKMGLQGLVKKICYWLLIAVAFVAAAVFNALGNDILMMDLSCCSLLGWYCLASLLVNELRSIIENLVQIGVYVPNVLTDGLEIMTERVGADAHIRP